MESQSVPKQVPVTILTGFLGSGKTSRLNATLAAGKERIAVIENELGALGVDGKLVDNVHEEDSSEFADGIIELSNGCLCCTGEVDLISALESLARRKRQSATPFERVIIETTGLADVAPIVALFRDPDEPLNEDFYLESVLTVVDALVAKRWFSDEVDAPTVSLSTGFGVQTLPGDDTSEGKLGVGAETARSTFWKQIALADQVVLSKIDLVGIDGLDLVKSVLSSANPLLKDGTIYCLGQTDPLPLSVVQQGQGGSMLPPTAFGGSKGHRFAKRPRGPSHLKGVEALSLQLPVGQVFDGDKLKVCALELLTRSSSSKMFAEMGEVWRIKGFVIVADVGLCLVQGVGDQVTLAPWVKAEASQPFLVVIGENLDSTVLEAALRECQSGAIQEQLAA